MNGVTGLLQLLSAACLGIWAGANLAEGFLLVPWWQSLAPADFFAWYAANDRRLLAFFSPLTVVTAVATLLSALALAWTAHPSRRLAAAACVLTLVAVAMFFLYFEAANASFSAASVPRDALAAELARWGNWHHARTVLSLIALACALVALRSPSPERS